MKNRMLEWIPLKKVGIFEFGKSLYEYSHLSDLLKLPGEFDPDVNWDVYTIKGYDIRLFFDDNTLVSIACYDECLYKNENLIGMSLTSFLESFPTIELKEYSEITIDSKRQQVYDLYEIGLQIWVYNKKIITVICGPHLDD